ncbi:MAG: hypothetical protein H7Y31_09610 [Chitinophagaceae bacterium]|nr:hypothetical protein [Chitinophagaceae bacterium]
MKKLLLVLAIGAFVACNNNAEGTDVKTDSPATTMQDTPTTIVIDSPVIKVDSPVIKVDTPAVKK